MNDKEIERLAEEALDAACLVIQNRLGVQTGDFAGIFFSGSEPLEQFQAYIRGELERQAES